MPNVLENKTYLEWKPLGDKDVFAIPCDHDDVEFYLENIVKFAKGTNSLIVLDDCASSQTVKNRTSELVKLAFHGRHIGLSTIVITQQLTSIAKPYRMNVSKVVFFVRRVKMIVRIFSKIIFAWTITKKKRLWKL